MSQKRARQQRKIEQIKQRLRDGDYEFTDRDQLDKVIKKAQNWGTLTQGLNADQQFGSFEEWVAWARESEANLTAAAEQALMIETMLHKEQSELIGKLNDAEREIDDLDEKIESIYIRGIRSQMGGSLAEGTVDFPWWRYDEEREVFEFATEKALDLDSFRAKYTREGDFIDPVVIDKISNEYNTYRVSGGLAATLHLRTNPVGAPPVNFNVLTAEPPSWEMSVSYGPVYRALQEIGQGVKDPAGPAPAVNTSALIALNSAHPVIVKPDWVEAQPPLSHSFAETMRYGLEVRLPFEQIYFDFTGPAWRTPRFPIESWLEKIDWATNSRGTEFADVNLLGAVCWQDDDPIGGQLAIAPILSIGPKEYDAKHRWIPAAVPGVVSFYPTDRSENMGPFIDRSELDKEGAKDFLAPIFVNAGVMSQIVDEPPDTNLPVTVSVALPTWEMAEDDTDCTNLALIAAMATDWVLRVLFLLDSSNVTVEDAPISRQMRRAAERKNRQLKISKIVRVDTPHRVIRSSDSNGNGQHRDYSHRFERAGSMAHYNPDTRLYQQSAPAYIKPCPRCGTCRRVWRPPTIVGPENKPFIPKARMAREKQE